MGAVTASAESRTGLAVCPKPSDRCDVPEKRFAPYELPFRLPRRLGVNVLYESAPFYAVVIRRERDPACDGGEYTRSVERFRRQAQRLFPERKVFADHQCPDMGAVSYTAVGSPADAETFVAVYAGTTRREADPVLARARGRFPQATRRRLRAGYSRVVQ